MKIIVYGICKNEAKHVARFMSTLSEADAVIICDTGSTDGTQELLRNAGAIVHDITIDPWRFDTARNVSLSMVPVDADVCVCIDLDEILTMGWRKSIEEAWTPETNRLRYEYVWSVLANGEPGVTFWYDKIHARNTHKWVNPVHEVLRICDTVEHQTYAEGFTLYHFPDHTKSRSNYLELLKLSVSESPNDDRSSHYYGRELMFYQHYKEAIVELKRHLSLPTAKWESERSASMRFIGKCYVNLKDDKKATAWLRSACMESPLEREPWVELAKFFYRIENWSACLYAVETAIQIIVKPNTYICDPEAWGSFPHDIGSIAAYKLGKIELARDLAINAHNYDPTNQRIIENIKLFEKGIK